MDWQPIETKPPRAMPVLLFYGRLVEFYDNPADLFDGTRDERFEVGFWDPTEPPQFCENGTGHDTQESMDQREWPTHWMPLPAPPAQGESK